MLHVLSSITSRQSTSNISHWDSEASPDSVHHWHSPADQPLKGLIRISENVLIIFRPRTSHPHNSIILLEVQLTKLTIIGNANTLWLTHHITYKPFNTIDYSLYGIVWTTSYLNSSNLNGDPLICWSDFYLLCTRWKFVMLKCKSNFVL